ncbi:MAG: hypothetical protein DRJ47_11210, partial [Thermoprotei archaeon]
LRTLVEELIKDPRIGGVVGRTKVEEGRTLTEQYYAQSDPFNFERYLNSPIVPWGGGNNAYRREVFEEVGYYDAENYTSGADAEFHYRMKTKTNYVMKYVPEACIYHVARGSIKEFFKQGVKYTHDGVLNRFRCPYFSRNYDHYLLKKTKAIVINLMGFWYRLLKLTIGQETELRVVEPLFDTVTLVGNIYGYLKAQMAISKTFKKN